MEVWVGDEMKTETNITVRWEKGTPHHHESIDLYRKIEAVDFKLGGDHLVLKSGGDGDNGEHLMYLMDIIFEARDNGETDDLCQLLRTRDQR